MSDNKKITLLNDEEQELDFTIIDYLEIDEKRYLVLLPDADPESGAIILRVEQDENNDDVLVEIEDDAEFDLVVKVLEEDVE